MPTLTPLIPRLQVQDDEGPKACEGQTPPKVIIDRVVPYPTGE